MRSTQIIRKTSISSLTSEESDRVFEQIVQKVSFYFKININLNGFGIWNFLFNF